MHCKMEDLKAEGEKVGLKINANKTTLLKVMTKQDGTLTLDKKESKK